MNVLAFKSAPARDGAWQNAEIERMKHAFAPELAAGDASEWQADSTEAGDPQFYLLGPLPDQECVLSVSRLGRLYILEDGAGRVMFENVKLDVLIQQAKRLLQARKAGVIARVTALCVAVHKTIGEKIEIALAEGEGALIHFAPQLAAFI